MRRATVALFLALAMTAIPGCSSGDRVDDTEGSVILRISDIDGLLLNPSVNQEVVTNLALFTVDTIELENIPKNSNLNTSPLMDVELRTYEVVYTRTDTGTRTPTPLVRSISGMVSVGGTLTIENLVLMSAAQLRNEPLSDLLLENGGIDSETGSDVITLELSLRFFGRTLSGDEVATNPASFELQFGP